MSDRTKSIFDKLYECVNNGVEWGVNYTKHPCPPKRKFIKKHSETLEDDSQGKKSSEAELESQKRLRIEEDPNSQGTIEDGHGFQEKSKDGKDFQEKSEDSSDFQKQKEKCPQPEEAPCCDILMQDPSRPCHETKEKHLKTCPSKKGYPDEPREPKCCCDCYKRRYAGKEIPFSEDARLERA